MSYLYRDSLVEIVKGRLEDVVGLDDMDVAQLCDHVVHAILKQANQEGE